MVEETTTSRLRSTWEAAAPGWAKWEPVWARAAADATDAMIDAAGVRPGMQVLDLACGAGSQTLRLAERIGPAGGVVASDISATMLEHVLPPGPIVRSWQTSLRPTGRRRGRTSATA